MPGRYFIKTFGCQMNEYDSSRMGDVLGRWEGLAPAVSEAEADVLLMNTCSVRDKAEDKVYSLLGAWRELKRQRQPLKAVTDLNHRLRVLAGELEAGPNLARARHKQCHRFVLGQPADRPRG